ncbi:DNA topoisomerase IB [Ktedonobacter robiniae]|uniref:DNA topoisomerase n=1 Tax=Ktedonobacter robiniae TaxID=2778365 RepID=A0ABQ3UFT8_9CHLR|nr:DNA topoisomerase IB [Ktedonobacter robiniae]GHO51593.1 DNA topoisomerase [Ktedonobacter robiniae]
MSIEQQSRQRQEACFEQPTAVESAHEAGLRYVTDSMPGITRKRAGRHFRYLDAQGEPVRDEKTLARIRSLVLPPAWKDVWICTRPNGHLQATGRDAKGRKQYRYHSQWREVRDATKYDSLVAFAHSLPALRQHLEQDLQRQGLTREKILATLVRLLDVASIRIGNEEYMRSNGSFGLTTMREGHVDIEGSTIHFCFIGKSGKVLTIDVEDRQLARIVKKCRELPGQELFQYVDSAGERHTLSSDDVNAYLQAVCGQAFTAKEFRTWTGTVVAVGALIELGRAETKTREKKNIGEAVDHAANYLGNTKAICRKCYVHPALFTSYSDGSLWQAVSSFEQHHAQKRFQGLSREEAIVLTLLEDFYGKCD